MRASEGFIIDIEMIVIRLVHTIMMSSTCGPRDKY